jgi:iron complex outermembrane recepter protein
MCEELYLGAIMKRWYFSGNVKLKLLITLSGCLSAVIIQPGWAEEKLGSKERIETSQLPQVSEIEFPVTNAQMLVQSPSPANSPSVPLNQENQVVIITGVKAKPTDKGLEVVLQTTKGEQLQVTNRSTGNNFIADIFGGQLRLPSGEAFAFRSEKPLSEITEINVRNIDNNTIRITVVGEKGLPKVELFDDDAGLIFGVTPTATAAQQQQRPEASPKPVAQQDDEPIELLVTGTQDSYRVPDASVGTRTDTPLRDIPQSIQVIPQQVIKDQQATRLIEVLKNAPGIVQGNRTPRDPVNNFNIRGFSSSSDILVNGLQNPSNENLAFDSNVERVEVLKGPASVLFGQGGLGGKVNLITKQPLRDPFYSVEASAGSYNFYRGAIDLSGPLNNSKTILYRLNASAQTNESFIDFYKQQRYSIAPALTFRISDRTKLTLEADYSRVDGSYDFGIPAIGSVLPNLNGNIARNRFVSEPDVNNASNSIFRVGYNFEHTFSDNWQVRSVFQASYFRLDRSIVFPIALQSDERTLDRRLNDAQANTDTYNLDNYVVGNFTTGSIKHQLIAGFNLFTSSGNFINLVNSFTPIDVFAPTYRTGQRGEVLATFDERSRTQQLGLYLQNQITLAENFKVLLGGRFDIANQKYEESIEQFSDFKQAEAFSPRVGIVYQPIKPLSFYASYSRSFQQGGDFVSALPEPERGTQYEIGVKADLTNQLAATLAFYDLTRSNLSTTDPNDSLRSIQVGEQRSRGIEFDITGEILPGWNIIAGYAFTDAQITKDNDFPVGNQLNNVPRHALNLWTTYELQSGNLKGLGFGLGIFYYGDRQGDLENTFELPGYTRTDASIFYKRDKFRASLNIRNLFDVDYWVSAQNRNRVIPGDPLTVQGTISWQF